MKEINQWTHNRKMMWNQTSQHEALEEVRQRKFCSSEKTAEEEDEMVMQKYFKTDANETRDTKLG